MMRATVVAILAVAALAVAACGGDSAEPAPTATHVPGSSGPVSDEAYLEIICTGLADYTAALLTVSTVDELRDVVRGYIASLEVVAPPTDLSGFHTDFVAYLRAALEDPTSLTAAPRPLPPDDVRDRLAKLESSVEACSDTTYFATREEDASR